MENICYWATYVKGQRSRCLEIQAFSPRSVGETYFRTNSQYFRMLVSDLDFFTYEFP